MLITIFSLLLFINILNFENTSSSQQAIANSHDQEFASKIKQFDIESLSNSLATLTHGILDAKKMPIEKIDNIYICLYRDTIEINNHLEISLRSNDIELQHLKNIIISDAHHLYRISSISLKGADIEICFATDLRPLSGLLKVVNWNFVDGTWKVKSIIDAES